MSGASWEADLPAARAPGEEVLRLGTGREDGRLVDTETGYRVVVRRWIVGGDPGDDVLHLELTPA